MAIATELQRLDTVVYTPTGHQGMIRQLRGAFAELAEVAFYRNGVVLVPCEKLRKLTRALGGRRSRWQEPQSWSSPTTSQPLSPWTNPGR
jgi:hypothetical protein